MTPPSPICYRSDSNPHSRFSSSHTHLFGHYYHLHRYHALLQSYSRSRSLASDSRNAQHADETICESIFGSSYTDACCSIIISRGPNSPCTDIKYVSNLTECSTRHYPTGWAVCVLKVCLHTQLPHYLGPMVCKR
jgi:hypothetical protein